jgi:hypothetical protein
MCALIFCFGAKKINCIPKVLREVVAVVGVKDNNQISRLLERHTALSQ